MMSSAWDDETALIAAVTEFYDSTVEDIQDYNIAVSPAQEYEAKQVDRLKKGGRSGNTDQQDLSRKTKGSSQSGQREAGPDLSPSLSRRQSDSQFCGFGRSFGSRS
jgi:hypothetical protein